MNRYLAAGAAAIGLTITMMSALPANAANGLCPSGTSLFGTVREVHSTTLLVKTVGPRGLENVSIANAVIHKGNLTLRPGIFIGAFGCFTEGYRSFGASEVTLSYDAATYPNRRHTETLTGIVRSVGERRILVDAAESIGFVQILTTDTANVKAKDRIRASGSFNPDGTFTASSVEDLSENPPPVSHLGVCPSGTSLFATIREVRGKTLLVKTVGPRGFENIRADDATIHSNGLSLRPGVFVGAFGCFTSDFRAFVASEITLSYDASTYPNERHTETLTGKVLSVGAGRILVETGMAHGDVNIMTADTAGAKAGSHVQVTGSFNPNGTFAATTVEITP